MREPEEGRGTAQQAQSPAKPTPTKARAGAALGLALRRVETWLIGLLGLCMLSVALFQIVARYAFPSLVAGGSEEIVVYLFVWAAMIACAARVTGDGHIRADLFLRRLSPRAVRLLEVVNASAALGFCAILVWYGWQVVDFSLLIDERSQTGLSFPLWIYYLALPVGGLLMGLRYLLVLWRLLVLAELPAREAGEGGGS